MNGERDKLQHAQNQLAIARLKLDALQEQLRGQVPYVPESSSKSTASGYQPLAGSTTRRLETAESDLANLRLKYTDKYPGVIELLSTIRQLKAEQARELAAIRRGSTAAAAASGLASNPVYQQIELSLNQQEVEVAGLEGQVRDHEETIAQLKRMMSEAPEIEAQYTRLDRGYNVTHAEYDALVQRLNQARVTERASEAGSIKFEIIDPPMANLAPVKPRRALITFAIFCGALGFGVALGWLRGQLRSVYELPTKLAADTGLTVIGTVSAMGIQPSAAAIRRQKLRFIFAASVLVIVFLAAMYLALKGVCYSSLMG